MESLGFSSTAISCRNSQGTALSASILRLRRYSVTFEVYNPYSVVQMSEVLKDFRIRINDRLVYEGTAVVSGLVNTGILMVCEATLGNAWLDVDFLSDRDGKAPLLSQFEQFMEDWKRGFEVEDAFKIGVADMQNLLIGIQRWLEQVDLGIRSSGSGDRLSLERRTLEHIQDRLFEEVRPVMEAFERIADLVPEGREAVHKSYLRRQLHPLILCSPFTYRTYHKPLGYAGDYEMVNMMLRDPYEGASLFAKILNRAFLETPPVIAHRNRIEYLKQLLHDETERQLATGGRTQVLNLGCGPAREIQDFLRNDELSDFCDLSLLDFNQETLEYTQRILTQIRAEAGRSTTVRYVLRSVNQLLKQATTGDVDMEWESFHLVYCAGLFDYLSQRVCRRLVEVFARLLRPGGVLVVTNVAARNPSRAWMEYVLEWNLVYRDDDGMAELVPPGGRYGWELHEDSTGVNLFLKIRKPERST